MEMTFKKEEILLMGGDSEFWMAGGDLIVNLDRIGDDTYFEGYVPIVVGGGAYSIAKVKVPSFSSNLYYHDFFDDDKGELDNIYAFINPTIADIFGNVIYKLDKESVQLMLEKIENCIYHKIPFGFDSMSLFMDTYDLQEKDVRYIIDEKDIMKWQNKEH